MVILDFIILYIDDHVHRRGFWLNILPHSILTRHESWYVWMHFLGTSWVIRYIRMTFASRFLSLRFELISNTHQVYLHDQLLFERMTIHASKALCQAGTQKMFTLKDINKNIFRVYTFLCVFWGSDVPRHIFFIYYFLLDLYLSMLPFISL